VLEAVMTFVAAEKFVSEANVTTHAAYNLMINHISRQKNSETKQHNIT